ncbi:MAG: hypothetical protein OHK0013_47110 [Sandaracinaceae bacterium]
MRPSSYPSSFALAAGLALAALAAGCDAGVPTFPALPIDAGIECSDETPCDGDEICLSGRCYARCTTTCGPMEVCVMGACVPGTSTDAGSGDIGPPDGGPPDAYVDPCTTVRCDSATPFCRAGVCLQCEDGSACGGAAPICDLGRGTCTGFAPALCAPCNNNLDCQGVGGVMFGSCVTRGGPGEPTERVCLPSCSTSGDCPAGLRCDRSTCVPAGGASCMQFLAAIAMQSCTSDASCAPVGATVETGLVTGSCIESTCRVPCGADADCPAALPRCDVPSGGFCAAP